MVEELQQLALRDDCDAMIILAALFRDGLYDRSGKTIVRRDPRSQLRHVQRAAHLGDAHGMTELAGILLGGANRKHLAEAVRLYKRAFKSGHTRAAFNLGIAYLNSGLHRLAVSWFRRAAARGDKNAVLQLAYAELYGLGIKRDAGAAVQRLLQLARMRRELSQFEREQILLLLATVHFEGWLVARSYRKGLDLLHRAASIGSAAAKGMLEDLDQ